jgi:hypothetical protein
MMPIFLSIVESDFEMAPTGRNKNFGMAFYVAQRA